jgi:hypothetical protein
MADPPRVPGPAPSSCHPRFWVRTESRGVCCRHRRESSSISGAPERAHPRNPVLREACSTPYLGSGCLAGSVRRHLGCSLVRRRDDSPTSVRRTVADRISIRGSGTMMQKALHPSPSSRFPSSHSSLESMNPFPQFVATSISAPLCEQLSTPSGPPGNWIESSLPFTVPVKEAEPLPTDNPSTNASESALPLKSPNGSTVPESVKTSRIVLPQRRH